MVVENNERVDLATVTAPIVDLADLLVELGFRPKPEQVEHVGRALAGMLTNVPVGLGAHTRPEAVMYRAVLRRLHWRGQHGNSW